MEQLATWCIDEIRRMEDARAHVAWLPRPGCQDCRPAGSPMTPRAPKPPSAEALFRYTVVAQIVVQMRCGKTRADALRDVTRRPHLTLAGHPRLVAQRTAYRWLSAFEQGALGIEALEPATRTRTTASVVLSSALLGFLRDQRAADPDASVPELIRRARELGIVDPDERIDRTTVYRAMKRMGLQTTRRKVARDRDTRRFAWPNRMQMVLCDGKHFRAGASRNKRVALFFLDDATRLVSAEGVTFRKPS